MRRELWIPGPMDCPEPVKQAMSRPMMNHRGKEFKHLLPHIIERLKFLIGTSNDVLTITGSGTTGIESATASFLMFGEKVIAPSVGHFGNLFADKIAPRYGINVVSPKLPWGTALDHMYLDELLKEHPDAAAVFLVHNETSTGVTNNLRLLALVARQHNKLVIVDAVSSLGALPCDVDEWGLDVVVTASQKGWSVPPGLAFMTVSDRAWNVYNKHRVRSYCLDVGIVKEFLQQNQTPCTPPLLTYYGLDVSLDLFIEEGMANVFNRYRVVADRFRADLDSIGGYLFPKPCIASDSVVTFSFGSAIKCADVQARLFEDELIEVAGGIGELNGQVLRCGLFGRTESDVERFMKALGRVVKSLS